MNTWIALLRGINVGGNNILPMMELKKALESLSLTNVKTYIQSGNIVFNTPSTNAKKLSSKMSSLIEDEHGFRPHIMLLSSQQLQVAVNSNPFTDTVSNPKSLHFYFLNEIPAAPDLSALEEAKSTSESYALKERVFYLDAPDGVGRSKLAAKVENYLGVEATSRNFRTVQKLLIMASELHGKD